MYLLNERQSSIIYDLLDAEDSIIAKNLSHKYNVSIRTIRYDMESIELWLKENQIRLMKKQKKGFWIIIDQEEKFKLKGKLKLPNSTIKVFSKDERKRIIISELLKNTKPINSDYISDKLGVSKTTLLGDINEIRLDLKPKDIIVEGKTGVGYSIQGNEKNIRELIGNMLSNDLDCNQLLDMLNQDNSAKGIINVLKEDISLNTDIDLSEIKYAIKMSKQILDFWIPDSSYISLILHIAIAIDRLKTNQEIKLPSEKINLLKTYREYVLAKEICVELEKSFGITIPEAEVANITFHLISANLKLNYLQSENIYDIKSNFTNAIDEIIEYLGNELTLPESSLNKLKNDLLSHLKLSIKKIELNISNTNPLLEQIKANYEQYFNIAEGIKPIFLNALNILLDDDEISYITLYIAAQCELYSKKITKNVLIVCTTGKGVAKILSAKIGKYFPEIIIKDTISIFELEEGDIPLDDIDFIISTLHISNVKVPVLKISPILTGQDLYLIKSYIYEINYKLLPQLEEQDVIIHNSLTSEARFQYELNEKCIPMLDPIKSDAEKIRYSEEIQRAEEIALVLADLGQLVEALKEYIDEQEIIPKIWGVAIHIIMAIPRWRGGQTNNEVIINELTFEQQNIYNVVDDYIDNMESKNNLIISESEKYSIAKYFF